MKERCQWIDFLKGFGILTVVFLHCCGGTDKYQILLKWITSFHMFLFFAISGFLTNTEKLLNFKNFIKKKFQGLMIPYFVFGVFLGTFFEIIRLRIQNYEMNIKELILNTVLFNSTFSATWFLVSLFLVYLIEFYVYKKVKSLKMRIAINCIITIIGFIMPIKFNNIARIKTTLVCCGFFCFGNILKNVENKLQNINFFWGIILNFAGTYVIFQNIDVSASMAMFGNPFLCCVGAFFIIIALFILSSKLYKLNSNIWQKFLNLISYAGSNSIIILCLHSFVILSSRLGAKIIGRGVHDLPVLLVFIYTTICSYLLIVAVKKMKIEFLFGKDKKLVRKER